MQPKIDVILSFENRVEDLARAYFGIEEETDRNEFVLKGRELFMFGLNKLLDEFDTNIIQIGQDEIAIKRYKEFIDRKLEQMKSNFELIERRDDQFTEIFREYFNVILQTIELFLSKKILLDNQREDNVSDKVSQESHYTIKEQLLIVEVLKKNNIFDVDSINEDQTKQAIVLRAIFNRSSKSKINDSNTYTHYRERKYETVKNYKKILPLFKEVSNKQIIEYIENKIKELQ